jgi:prepilin-type processing-associated H-X9-DG protein
MGIMKTQIPTYRTEAFTRIELFVVITVIVLLAVWVLPALSTAKQKAMRINCANNLHQIGTTFKLWEGDDGNKRPMQFAPTNSKAMKLIGSGNACVLWQTMSNMEMSTPRVLRCPEDAERAYPTNFTAGFSDANISYFFNLDALNETYPQMILSGDDNLAVNGVRVKPGILNFPTTNSLAWTKERHLGLGNIGMADGSVQQTTPAILNAAVINATNGVPVATYRWVIP